MPNNLEKISEDKGIQLLYVTVMQELEDIIQRFNRFLVLLGIVNRFSEKEGSNQGMETIKKKVLKTSIR
jgi:hypothetical protein